MQTQAAQDATPSPGQEEARLESMLVPGGVSLSTRSAALQQFQAQIQNPIADDSSPAQPMRAARLINRPDAQPGTRFSAISPQEREDQLLAGLLLGSPEFQRR